MSVVLNNLSLAFALAGFAVAIAAACLVFGLRRRWAKVFGKRARGDAEIVGQALERLVTAERRLDELEPRLDTLEAIGKAAVQKVGFLRYNPFAEIGGDQSFTLALLNREDSGVVISSLYTREGVRVYAKRIERGASKHPLSEEEQEAIRQAMSTWVRGNG